SDSSAPAYAARMTGRSERIMSAYSWSARTAATPASANSHQPPAQTTSSTSGRPTSVTSTRETSGTSVRRSGACGWRSRRERRGVAAADEARPHSLTYEVGQLALDRFGEDLHQELHLVRRPIPVLRRERVDRERVDAEIDRRLDGTTQRFRPGPVSGRDRKST